MESKLVPGIEIVSMDEPIDYWTRVEWSRQLSFSDKFQIGIEMFEVACAEICERIQTRFPGIPDPAVDEILGLLVEKSRRE